MTQQHYFLGVRALSEATGIPYHKLKYDVDRGIIPFRKSGKYYFFDANHPTIKSMLENPSAYEVNRVKLRPRKVLYNGKIYPSVRALAKAVKRNTKTVTYWLYSGKAVYLDK